MPPIKDIESQLFKNKHLNKIFSLFKSIGNGKFWIGFLLEIIFVIVIFVINIFWENHWFNLVISSFNLLLFAYVMNQCVEGIADRSNNYLTGLINNMGGNIAELFAVIIFMNFDQALLAGFTILGLSISTVMIGPALAAIISIFRSRSLKPFKFNAIDAQNIDENEFYIRIKENNIKEDNEENNTENNEENNTENNEENNTENNKENNTEKNEFKNNFKNLLKDSKFIIKDEIEENSQDANDTKEENLENEDDKNAKKRSLIELIILILLFAITCAGFYFVGEIFSDSIQKTPLSERLAFVGIFFTPAMLDVPPDFVGNKRKHEEDEDDNRKIAKTSTSFDCDIEFSELYVIDYIDKGGFGTVYKVLWNKGKENEQTAAVKVVPNSDTQQSERDFKRELCFGLREKPVHGLPISYKAIYEKCWEDNPSYKYAKISDILEALDNIEQTPIYSEESKDKSLESLKQMDIETIIKSPSNVESDSTKGMELSMSISEFFQSYEKFEQLISDIENSYQAAQLNKKICRELYFCIDNARLNMNRLRYSIQDSNTPVALKDFMLFQQNVVNIKKFIENISNIRGLEHYIQKINSVITLEKIKNEATELLIEFNESMSSLFQKQEYKIENAIQCDFENVNTMFKVIKKVMNQLANNLSEHNEQTIIVNKISGSLHKIGDSIVFCKEFNLNQKKDIYTQANFLKSLEGLPNVASFCRIIKDETSPHLIYFALEWSECGNLKEFIARNGLNFQNKLSFALDICKGLVFLNAVKALHRDIRPENIIVINDIAKITNFDFSRLMSDVSRKIDINRDNIRYSAPELLKREPNKQDPYDSRCEVYSFGTIIWEILNEKPPFEEYNDPSKLKELKEMILCNKNVDLKNSINKLSQEFSHEYKKIINEAIRPTICDMFKILHSMVNDDNMMIDKKIL
ncbi:4844_t:CDS:2 [Gigaspora margarita]|uniref:4844_t:CDS:1 n=1 Tax=Gigaspora margarita TaxID=4874 RepID=A0ABM8VXN2_GIGMA|nr:4844_t:CDS:2 [Gigaspora margarita]